jgi:HK97 family phage portal protein
VQLPLVFANGIKASPLTIKATDAQLLEARAFQVSEIARAFGVPPHMIGETTKATSWGTGIEQQTLGFVKFTLTQILRQIEQELNRKIWPERMRYFAEFNVNGLLRGDSKSRADYYRAALGGAQGDGWMVVNEVRKFENLEPIAGGNELFRAKRGGEDAQGGANPGDDPGEPGQGSKDTGQDED